MTHTLATITDKLIRLNNSLRGVYQNNRDNLAKAAEWRIITRERSKELRDLLKEVDCPLILDFEPDHERYVLAPPNIDKIGGRDIL